MRFTEFITEGTNWKSIVDDFDEIENAVVKGSKLIVTGESKTKEYDYKFPKTAKEVLQRLKDYTGRDLK